MVDKILFTYGNDTKEEFESLVPLTTMSLANESVSEIEATGVIERVPDLVKFTEECYRLLKFGGKLTLKSAHYRNDLAWQDPYAVRGISELSMNFAAKAWRDLNKFADPVMADFEVVGNFAIEQSFMQRADDARAFMMRHYNNIVQAVIFTLTKKEPDAV
jgi:hypothetical protein